MIPEIEPPEGSGRERLPDRPEFSAFGDSEAGTLTIELVGGDQSVRTIRVQHSGPYTRTERDTDRVVCVRGVVRVEDTGHTVP